jgi:hypothetical protein
LFPVIHKYMHFLPHERYKETTTATTCIATNAYSEISCLLTTCGEAADYLWGGCWLLVGSLLNTCRQASNLTGEPSSSEAVPLLMVKLIFPCRPRNFSSKDKVSGQDVMVYLPWTWLSAR